MSIRRRILDGSETYHFRGNALNDSGTTVNSFKPFFNGKQVGPITVDKEGNFDYSYKTPLESTEHMFNCSYGGNNCAIAELRIFEFNTTNVTNMSYMFYDLGDRLTVLELLPLDTSNVTDMSWMLGGCRNLKKLDLSNFITTNVINMSYMFSGCYALRELNISSFDTSNVTDMSYMFNNAMYISSATTLAISNFNTSNVVNMNSMLRGIRTYIYTLDLSKFSNASLQSLDYMFYECFHTWEIILPQNFVTNKITSLNGVFGSCQEVSSITHLDTWDTSNVTNMSATFSGCRPLKSLKDVEKWNTSKVTSMQSLFYYCSGDGISLDLSNWDVSQVSDMSRIFNNCSVIKSTDSIKNWDVSNVTTMEYMFRECNDLTALELPNWNTSNVTNLHEITYWCRKLETIDLSNWDTSNVTEMSSAFGSLYRIQTINLHNWTIENVTDLYGMFSNDKILISLDISNFGRPREDADVDRMFANNAALETIQTTCEFKEWAIENADTIQLPEKFRDSCYSGWVTPNDCQDCFPYIIDINLYFCLKEGEDVDYLDSYLSGTTYGDAIITTDSNTSSTYPLNVTEKTKETDGSYRLKIYSTLNGLTEGVTKLRFDFPTYPSNTAIEINVNELKGFNDLTSCEEMFNRVRCSILTLPSNFRTSNVTTMKSMFNNTWYGWDYITNYTPSVDIIDLTNFDTSNVTDMSSMFQFSGPIPYDLSSFDTSKVKGMNDMFSSAKWSPNYENLSISNVTSMSYMFAYSVIDKFVSPLEWDYSNVINITGLFHKCLGLELVDMRNFNITSYRNRPYYMFSACENLKVVDLSGLKLDLTKNSYNRIIMTDNCFESCSALTYLNISSFEMPYQSELDTETKDSLIEEFTEFFSGCPNLKYLVCSCQLYNFLETNRSVTKLPSFVKNITDETCPYVNYDGSLKELMQVDELHGFVRYSDDVFHHIGINTSVKYSDYSNDSTNDNSIIMTNYDESNNWYTFNLPIKIHPVYIDKTINKCNASKLFLSEYATILGFENYTQQKYVNLCSLGFFGTSSSTYNTVLEEVYITNCVLSNLSFRNCEALKKIIINNATSINSNLDMTYAFWACKNLEYVDFGDLEVSNISGYGLFYNNKEITIRCKESLKTLLLDNKAPSTIIWEIID